MFETMTPRAAGANPWHALWALLIGFFMILVDATIVAVANPAIMSSLDTDYDAVIWVTSAYLLAYAVPLLVSGRLGDRYGPKNMYLVGLAVFTAASLWCGLSDTIGMLIAARVVQGVGAALLTPQTLSVITRIFPANRRGVAMSIWGATAGVATLVGPLAGGVLVEHLGWQWIFIVNVPVGIVGLAVAVWLVPALPTHRQGLDMPGVLLSGVGLFLIVFGLQEGQANDWALWIWATIFIGAVVMAAFLYWQSIHTGEPLIPLTIFGDRDFSMSNLGVATIGFVATAMMLPLMFYAQVVCGLSPTGAALLIAPMAVATGVLAPWVGRIVDRSQPTPVVGFGFSVMAIGLTWLSVEMTPTTPVWRLLIPLTVLGVGMAFIWSPLAATATRNLPPQRAGAGSGVYNTTRQVGSVLGSAGIAALMVSRLSAEMPVPVDAAQRTEGSVTELPTVLYAPFAAAMSQAMLLPALVALFGVIAAIFMVGFANSNNPQLGQSGASPVTGDGDHDWGDDEFDDDDDYVEYLVNWDHPEPLPVESDDAGREPDVPDLVTEPFRAGSGRAAAHSETSQDSEARYGEWRNILDQITAEPVAPRPDAVSGGRNGFLFDDDDRSAPQSGPRPDGHSRDGSGPSGRRPRVAD